MESEFLELENAELRFRIFNHSDAEVDGWGNPAIVTTEAERLVVRAYLRPSESSKLQQLANSGVDIGTEYLEGYAIEPFDLPDWLEPGTPCDATIDGRAGTFEYLPATKSARAQIEAEAGSMIQGYFRQQVQ